MDGEHTVGIPVHYGLVLRHSGEKRVAIPDVVWYDNPPFRPNCYGGRVLGVTNLGTNSTDRVRG